MFAEIAKDNNVSVFIPGQIASNMTLHNGENISVVGVVQTYQGKKEVVVQSGSDISSNSCPERKFSGDLFSSISTKRPCDYSKSFLSEHAPLSL